ncbi:RNA polymerase sigma-70 factor (ECF subfamily) [Nocardioides sp. BE266]|uniref:RNA polymerase sigma factor SigM n=1 Tax=Nocardioides sp. BE266 TaxID=2817725 RepID=UPI00286598B8|nr:RNA polymerase sigma factor SigM [Nocardioides sp. BE266]MDR7253059.1 RNA polymerase sigma-70 factor (ECF subfamily) [Nocardioides sp. BE266]
MTTPASDERSDQALLRAHVDGDAEAFGVLFSRHRDRLWAVALRTMGNPEDAADGLQDGMIAAFRRAGSFRGEAAVTTWLHRVVVNACLDRLRAAKIRRLEALPDDVEDRGTLVATAEHDDQPDAAAEDAERRRRVLAALATLPPDQRAALVLVDMEGYPVAEVAEMLGCAEGTVKSRCSRGRAKLADLLLDLHQPPGDPPHGNPPPDGPVQPMLRERGPPAP